MKKLKLKIVVLFFGLLFTFVNVELCSANDISSEKVYCSATLDDFFSDNIIIVTLTNSESLKFKTYTEKDFNEISCIKIEDLSLPFNQEKNVLNYRKILLLYIESAGKQNVLDKIKILEQRDDIFSAEPNYCSSLNRFPNDIGYWASQQWGIDKIALANAWDITIGINEVKVGVIDTGIDATHPDLVNQVDRTLSRDFTLEGSYEVSVPTDYQNHGTAVAGIIGATGDNDIGITGVSWNVTLISLKATSYNDEREEHTFELDAILRAIQYSSEVGIDILNFSGGRYTDLGVSINQAISGFDGLFVCSSGNDHNNNDITPYYPSNLAYDNVISVGNSNRDDCIFTGLDAEGNIVGSNYGKNTVDLFAPGTNIYTTDSTQVVSINDCYSNHTGTSYAAPFVSGVAALLLSKYPTLTASELKASILMNVDIVDSLDDLCISGGRLNAYKAISGVHFHNFEYLSLGSSGHQKSCDCGYFTTQVSGHYIVAGSCSYCSYLTHTHSYTSNYVWIDTTNHKGICSCGAIQVQGHAVANNNPNICIKCGGQVEMGFIMPFAKTAVNRIVTRNGSYIWEGRILVLVQADIVSFMEGELVIEGF